MKNKILVITGCMLLLGAVIMLGMGLALAIYNRHLCCDKGSDGIYYIVASVICYILSIIFFKWRKNEDKSK